MPLSIRNKGRTKIPKCARVSNAIVYLHGYRVIFRHMYYIVYTKYVQLPGLLYHLSLCLYVHTIHICKHSDCKATTGFLTYMPCFIFRGENDVTSNLLGFERKSPDLVKGTSDVQGACCNQFPHWVLKFMYKSERANNTCIKANLLSYYQDNLGLFIDFYQSLGHLKFCLIPENWIKWKLLRTNSIFTWIEQEREYFPRYISFARAQYLWR